MDFVQNLENLVEKDTMDKPTSRGAEWRKFYVHSTFQCGVKEAQIMSSNSVKTPDYSPMGFGQKLKILI